MESAATTSLLRLAWLLSITAVIIGSVLPAQTGFMQLIDSSHVNDKVEHFSSYAVLGALPVLRRFRTRRPFALLAFACVLGGMLELIQIISPGRSCDWRDFAADCLGVAAGAFLVHVLQRASGAFVNPASAPLADQPRPAGRR